ncbi:MAG: DUF4272 domain-containing protein [Planctomycetes bacterium]|nr:DUF4272 domain-containing protein [Planctomycetota bacterium]
MSTPSTIRSHSLAALRAAGFQCAASLPHGERHPTLRPASEIAARFAALRVLFLFVAAPESHFPESSLRPSIDGTLKPHFTPEELEIISLPRVDAAAQHNANIGWKRENMVALAWVLNRLATLPFDGSMLKPELIRPLITQTIPADAPLESWLAIASTRTLEEIIQMEDAFYCLHNAARCAQFPAKPSWKNIFSKPFKPVPAGFDPIVNGGVIHERRHALTWALSPGTAWDDTDLST